MVNNSVASSGAGLDYDLAILPLKRGFRALPDALQDPESVQGNPRVLPSNRAKS